MPILRTYTRFLIAFAFLATLPVSRASIYDPWTNSCARYAADYGVEIGSVTLQFELVLKGAPEPALRAIAKSVLSWLGGKEKFEGLNVGTFLKGGSWNGETIPEKKLQIYVSNQSPLSPFFLRYDTPRGAFTIEGYGPENFFRRTEMGVILRDGKFYVSLSNRLRFIGSGEGPRRNANGKVNLPDFVKRHFLKENPYWIAKSGQHSLGTGPHVYDVKDQEGSAQLAKWIMDPARRIPIIYFADAPNEKFSDGTIQQLVNQQNQSVVVVHGKGANTYDDLELVKGKIYTPIDSVMFIYPSKIDSTYVPVFPTLGSVIRAEAIRKQRPMSDIVRSLYFDNLNRYQLSPGYINRLEELP